MGTLKKNSIFFFFSISGRQRLAIPFGDVAILQATVIKDFALKTLENILFSFSLSSALNGRKFSRNGTRTGHRRRFGQGKKDIGRLKFFLFIDRYRFG